MGRVAELNHALGQIVSACQAKQITPKESTEYHYSACIESIAKSLAWYMDRTEKLDRYEPEETIYSEEGEVIFNGDLISRKEVIERLKEDIKVCGMVDTFAKMIEEWINEIPAAMSNGVKENPNGEQNKSCE